MFSRQFFYCGLVILQFATVSMNIAAAAPRRKVVDITPQQKRFYTTRATMSFIFIKARKVIKLNSFSG